MNFLSVNLHLMMVNLILRLLLIKTNDKFILLKDFILSTNLGFLKGNTVAEWSNELLERENKP